MIDSVSRLIPTAGLDQVKPLQATGTDKTSGSSFSEVLSHAIEQVNTDQLQADKMTEALAAGKAPDLHTVMITAEKATLSFQMAVQVRNKAVEAYQEIMRMQM
jgi:flagellar hook-basal body complex protein FliE